MSFFLTGKKHVSRCRRGTFVFLSYESKQFWQLENYVKFVTREFSHRKLNIRRNLEKVTTRVLLIGEQKISILLFSKRTELMDWINSFSIYSQLNICIILINALFGRLFRVFRQELGIIENMPQLQSISYFQGCFCKSAYKSQNYHSIANL